ncbi:MAG: type II toxin-antitoxin system HicA family toxin [Acidobacteriota bacterium]
MSKVPSLPYTQVIAALKRAGWSVVRQEGSHIRLDRQGLRITIPAHKPIKRSTLSQIIKQAGLTVDEFLDLL